jgi:hypothetical protein
MGNRGWWSHLCSPATELSPFSRPQRATGQGALPWWELEEDALVGAGGRGCGVAQNFLRFWCTEVGGTWLGGDGEGGGTGVGGKLAKGLRLHRAATSGVPPRSVSFGG